MKRMFVYWLVMVSPILVVGTVAGCKTQHVPDYSNIPLTQGDAPYRLPKGIYIDTRGVVHNEKEYRWSISESDLFNVSDEDYLIHIKNLK